MFGFGSSDTELDRVIYYVGIIYGWYWTWDCNGRGLVSIRLFSFVSYYTITEYLSTELLWVNSSFPLILTNYGYTTP